MELRPFDLHHVVRPYCASWLTISTRPCTCRCLEDSASFVDRVGKLSIRSGGTWSRYCSACALIRQNREIPRRFLRRGGGGSKSCQLTRMGLSQVIPRRRLGIDTTWFRATLRRQGTLPDPGRFGHPHCALHQITEIREPHRSPVLRILSGLDGLTSSSTVWWSHLRSLLAQGVGRPRHSPILWADAMQDRAEEGPVWVSMTLFRTWPTG